MQRSERARLKLGCVWPIDIESPKSGNTKGGSNTTVDLLFDWFGISCMTTDNFCFYLQNRLIQTSQTGGQPYSDTSPFSIPCQNRLLKVCYVPNTSASLSRLLFLQWPLTVLMVQTRQAVRTIKQLRCL